MLILERYSYIKSKMKETVQCKEPEEKWQMKRDFFFLNKKLKTSTIEDKM